VVATSGRAIAQGLKSLGHSVTVIDGFADCDTCAAAKEIKKVMRAKTGLDCSEALQAVVSLQSKTSFDGIFYDAALESNPSLLDKISTSFVFGNTSQVLSICKNPKLFFSILDQHSIAYPEVSFKPITDNGWLIKLAQSTGGVGVFPMSGQIDFSENLYLQKKIDGINFSLTFLANGKELLELGFNTLWSEPLGSDIPYAYAGAINQVKLDIEIQETAVRYAKVIVKEFELVGLNSIDFIFTGDLVYVLEINPRIPATYELYESKYGELMNQHIEACKSRILPAVKSQALLRAHAIVYAPSDINVSENMTWPLWTADRPHAQDVIRKFEPVCSIFAGGQNSSQVYEMIKTRKQTILAKLAQ